MSCGDWRLTLGLLIHMLVMRDCWRMALVLA